MCLCEQNYILARTDINVTLPPQAGAEAAPEAGRGRRRAPHVAPEASHHTHHTTYTIHYVIYNYPLRGT